jgi:hypothetical protein
MAAPAYSSPTGLPRNLVGALARVFGIGGTGAGIDFAAAGGIIGLASGIIGLIVGLIGIAEGVIGVIGGVLGIVTGGVLGIIAGGVLGVVARGAVGTGIILRNWSLPGSFGVFTMRAGGCDAGLLMATAPSRTMRVASAFMPGAMGRRWIEEAQIYLFEAPAEQRSQAARNYLLTAPQVIAVSWTAVLVQRIRLARGEPRS